MRKTILALAALMLALAVVPIAAAKVDRGGPKPEQPRTTEIQILGLNDFHGQLEVVDPIASSGGRIGSLTGSCPTQTCPAPTCIRPAASSTWRPTSTTCGRRTREHAVRLGRRPDRRDAAPVGALPRRADDRGVQPDGARLQRRRQPRVRRGHRRAAADAIRQQSELGSGCHPVDGCRRRRPVRGRRRSSSSLRTSTYKTERPRRSSRRYRIHKFKGGAKVGIIGMTLEGTPEIVTPGRDQARSTSSTRRDR